MFLYPRERWVTLFGGLYFWFRLPALDNFADSVNLLVCCGPFSWPVRERFLPKDGRKSRLCAASVLARLGWPNKKWRHLGLLKGFDPELCFFALESGIFDRPCSSLGPLKRNQFGEAARAHT